MRCFIFILSAVLFLSCGTRIRYVPVKSTEVMTVRLVDTAIKTALVPYRDSVSLRDTVSYLSNPYAESWAWYEDGRLNHSLNVTADSIAVRVRTEYVDRTQRGEVPIEVERELSSWENVKMRIGGWCVTIVPIVVFFVVFYFARIKKM